MALNYLLRVVDAQLLRALRNSGAVLVKGPKWSGKTATSLQQAASALFLQDPDYSPGYLATADTKPSLLLQGEQPRLIDEWQMAPQLWDAVRFAVDRQGGTGLFILTGSTTPTVTGSHSGVGRIAHLVMRTMSLFESQDSSGEISLGVLFDGGNDVAALSSITVEDYAAYVCRGGWPTAVTMEMDSRNPGEFAQQYVSGFIESDVSRLDGVTRNATRMRALLRSYARHVGTQASQATINGDRAIHEQLADPRTIADYLDALRRAYVIEDLEAWAPSLRSKTALRTSPTRHFIDPSIGLAVNNITPAHLLRDFESFGLVFKSLVVRDLRIYAESLGGRVAHYRDKTGLEADAIIELGDGRWAAIEVKMGAAEIEKAAQNLLKLESRINTELMGPPSFLAVITAGETAYTRADGIHVFPLGVLGP